MFSKRLLEEWRVLRKRDHANNQAWINNLIKFSCRTEIKGQSFQNIHKYLPWAKLINYLEHRVVILIRLSRLQNFHSLHLFLLFEAHLSPYIHLLPFTILWCAYNSIVILAYKRIAFNLMVGLWCSDRDLFIKFILDTQTKLLLRLF